MKLLKKYLCIWAAGMLAIAFVTNLAGALVSRYFLGGILVPGMIGYSKKMTFPLQPATNEQEQKANGAVMMVRTVLSDTSISNTGKFVYNFLMMNVDIDQSCVFLNKDGLHECSAGIFLTVVDNPEDDTVGSYLTHVIGMVDVRKLAEQDCFADLCTTLEEHPEAVIYLNTYTVHEDILEPGSVTVRDADGSELFTAECTCEGEPIHADNVFISPKHGVNGTVSEYFDIAMKGERKSDKTAMKLAETISFENGDMEQVKTSFGLMNVTVSRMEVMSDNAGVSTFVFYYWRGAVLYFAIFSLVLTLLLFLRFRNSAWAQD